ncbi:hypothetical protein [Amycolatopsis sp. A1MSW2902]|uniref:hypothetical protein n=1 Tax=Amycolatopsis sp. A1MSW2902 TaxID=687413 RepID=UPI00307EDC53
MPDELAAGANTTVSATVATRASASVNALAEWTRPPSTQTSPARPSTLTLPVRSWNTASPLAYQPSENACRVRTGSAQ